MNYSRLGIIGCGQMAYALLKGIMNNQELSFDSILVNDISEERVSLFAREFKANPCSTEELAQNSDIIILAVKPNQIENVLTGLRIYKPNQLFISIAAGIKISQIEKLLPKSCAVVRVMPNTPALAGEGMSVIAPGSNISEEQTYLVKKMMQSTGKARIMDEDYLDAVTALSGSGPAYVFLIVEAMIDAGVKIGLSADIARELVLQTVKGSVAMLELGQEHPAVLRQKVCSPAGTTIAAVKELEANGLRNAFYCGIEAAWKRSAELAHREIE